MRDPSKKKIGFKKRFVRNGCEMFSSFEWNVNKTWTNVLKKKQLLINLKKPSSTSLKKNTVKVVAI